MKGDETEQIKMKRKNERNERRKEYERKKQKRGVRC